MPIRCASVIVDVATRSLSRPFLYEVPPELSDVRVGCAVAIELGARPVVGYVIELVELDAEGLASRGVSDASRLKKLGGLLSEPFFSENAVSTMRWVAHTYACPLTSALHLFTPPGGAPKVKRVDGEWTLVHPGVGPVDDRWVFPCEGASDYEVPERATKQRAVLEALEEGGMRVAELAMLVGGVGNTLPALEKRGLVRIETRRRIRDVATAYQPADTRGRNLTTGQQSALDAITASLRGDASHEHVVVMDGITGSGKTEVYLLAIEQVRAAGKSAIVLVPEIALTPQTVGRFRARFGDDVAVLHSRLSTGERFDQWDLVRSGLVHVVVGTRSALFAPVSDLGLVVIDEEHDSSYKQDSAPRYTARDVAFQMCSDCGATLVLGSATPSIETLVACTGNGPLRRNWHRVVLDERPNGAELPEVTVVDMGDAFKRGSRSMFSDELVAALQGVNKRGEKAVLLLNKRGFATFLLCRECGYVPECPNCSVSLTYHEREGHLACHHCEYTQPVPVTCPECSSRYLRKFGTGTERVELQLRETIGDDVPIIRMDADTTKGKGAHERLLEEFRSAKGGILLGTQMIAKGLDFPEVTLVGVINADTTLKLPDYRAPERTYQLLEQVSGRAGRAGLSGRVIVQTYWPEHPAILAAAAHDRSLWLDEELLTREELLYPPFARLANVLIWGKNEHDVRLRATEVSLKLDSLLNSAGLDWIVLGPSPCLLSRLRGDWRWHILVKAPPGQDVSPLLVEAISAPKKLQYEVRVAVDVDPQNLF